ncbi:MAG: hypothetical protein AAB383_06410 [Patescibacteria group bacterium]
MKISKLYTALLASLLLTGCIPTENSETSETSISIAHITAVDAVSFTMDPVVIEEDGSISNPTVEAERYEVSDATVTVNIRDGENPAKMKTITWEAFYNLSTQTDAFNADSLFDISYKEISTTDSATGEEINYHVEINITEHVISL